jgi:hypothetical protein
MAIVTVLVMVSGSKLLVLTTHANLMLFQSEWSMICIKLEPFQTSNQAKKSTLITRLIHFLGSKIENIVREVFLMDFSLFVPVTCVKVMLILMVMLMRNISRMLKSSSLIENRPLTLDAPLDIYTIQLKMVGKKSIATSKCTKLEKPKTSSQLTYI